MTATATGQDTREIPGVGVLQYVERPRSYRLITPESETVLPSVTEILGETWAKPFLVGWAAKLGQDMYRVREEAFSRGRDTHAFIEAYMRDGTLLPFSDFPDDRKPYLMAAAKFLFDHDPKPLAVERLVCHPELGFAGRFDLLAELQGQPTLLDFKTNPAGNTYPEGHVQLAGYAVADKRCGGDPIPQAAIVGIAESGEYRLVPTPMDEAAAAWLQTVAHYRAMHTFLGALDA